MGWKWAGGTLISFWGERRVKSGWSFETTAWGGFEEVSNGGDYDWAWEEGCCWVEGELWWLELSTTGLDIRGVSQASQKSSYLATVAVLVVMFSMLEDSQRFVDNNKEIEAKSSNLLKRSKLTFYRTPIHHPFKINPPNFCRIISRDPPTFSTLIATQSQVINDLRSPINPW
jgi:hypothetical protein